MTIQVVVGHRVDPGSGVVVGHVASSLERVEVDRRRAREYPAWIHEVERRLWARDVTEITKPEGFRSLP